MKKTKKTQPIAVEATTAVGTPEVLIEKPAQAVCDETSATLTESAKSAATKLIETVEDALASPCGPTEEHRQVVLDLQSALTGLRNGAADWRHHIDELRTKRSDERDAIVRAQR